MPLPTSTSADTIRVLVEGIKGNLSALNSVVAPAWVDAPEYRGTMSILVSCAVTLVACIYTALHLNVPQVKGAWPRLLSKLKWVFVGLVCPELAVWSAFKQYLLARSLVNELRRLQGQSKTADKGFCFDLPYAFFVILGGVGVSVKEIVPTWEERTRVYRESNPDGWPETQRFPSRDGDGDELWELPHEAIVELARLDFFVYVSPRQIADKSKADIVQKTLVLVQVVWFFVQCVARKAYDLPLSLLEVHTVVHVVCALVMYALWWEKPLGITVPEKIDDSQFRDLVALMVQETREKNLKINQSLVLYTDVSTACQVGGAPGSTDVPLIRDENDNPIPVILFDPSRPYLTPGSALPCGIGTRSIPGNPAIQLLLEDITRLERVSRACRKLDPKHVPAVQAYTAAQTWCRYPDRLLDRVFFYRNDNLPPHVDRVGGAVVAPSRLGRLFEPLSILFTVLYGGMHLAAWSSAFPTAAERALWRASCLVVMGGLAALFGLSHYREWATKREGGGGGMWLWERVMFFLVLLAVFGLYLAARLFIVVESFVSLRSVPAGVYWTPSWLQMIPHV